MKRDHDETKPYVPSFYLADCNYSVEITTRQLEPNNLNMYVIHLKEKASLPKSSILVIDQKKRLPVYRKRFKSIVHYDYTYLVFETHALRCDETGEKIMDIIIELNESEDFVPKFDMCLYWVNGHFHNRFKSLDFFPPDLNLEQQLLGVKVNLRTLPPKTSIALKQRGDVSGSKSYTLMGYFVPTKQEDDKWSYDAPKVYTKEQKDRMNRGQVNEEVAILFYLIMFQRVTYEQIGWCRAPPPLPINWGALPDGFVIDPDASVPKEIQDWYPDLDPTRGCLEVKCTDKNLTFEPYFYPQVYMEMISAGVMWCDVLRFCKSLTKVKNKWKTEYTARLYRIYRHQPTERVFISLLKYALAHKVKLQEVVHMDERFVSFRKFLGELAASEPFKMLPHTEHFTELMTDYTNYKKQIY